MNLAIIMGRLCAAPETRYTAGEKSMAISRFTLAVDRRGGKGDTAADFIRVVCFDKKAEFAEKYLSQGQRVLVTGSIKTGSYTNKDGIKIPTFEIYANDVEFADSKKADVASGNISPDKAQQAISPEQGFMQIPDGIDDQGLPFN